MEVYPTTAVERAMKVQEVMLKAMTGQLKWIEAAEVLGMSPRTMRRWRFRLERDGTDALLDRRRRLPSPRRAPVAEVQRILQLFRDRYGQFNVRHFHEIAQREHGVTQSYSFVKGILQGARLVSRRRPRGKHRLRRPRRECFGELLHLDGSPHRWLALAPDLRCTLISVVDDATSQALYGQLWPEETTVAVMATLAAVIRTHGLPQALYTDRACWAACSCPWGRSIWTVSCATKGSARSVATTPSRCSAPSCRSPNSQDAGVARACACSRAGTWMDGSVSGRGRGCSPDSIEPGD
jgi:transposase